MKSNKFIFLLVLFFAISSSAQKTSLRWSKKIPTKGKITILGGINDKYYTTHRGKKQELVGRIYDEKMNMIQEKLINFNLSAKKYFYQGAFFVDGKILHFIRDNVRKRGKSSIYAAFSDANLDTSSKVLVVDETLKRGKTSYLGTRNISPDSTKVMLYHQIERKKKEPKKIVYKIYNSGITKIIQQDTVSIPIKAKNFSTQLVEVDNLGNFYLLARVNKERKERKKNHSKYYFKLFVFSKDKPMKVFDFDYPNNDISFFEMIPGKNNKFFCAGYLTKLKGRKKTSVSDEMFLAKLDCKTLTLEKSNMIKVKGLYPEKKRGNDYLPYKIRSIYEKSDGGYSVVSEQFQLIVVHNRYGSSYTYYYGDIACTQITKDMKVTSIAKIPKFQKNAKNPSIISTFKKDKTYIVYEDVASNINATNDKDTKKNTGSIFSSRNKNALFLLTVNEQGKPTKEIIYDYKDKKIKPYILGSLSMKNGKILLSGRDQLGILEVN